jgi:hypothetical protein
MDEFTTDEWADEFNAAWSKAEPADAAGGNVPDGTYNTFVDRALVKKSKTANRPMLEITLKITGPTHAKRLLWLTHMLDREQGYPYLKADLELLGIHIATLTELPDRLEEFIGQRVRVTVKNNPRKDGGKPFVNVYLNSIIDPVDMADANDGRPVAEGDLPF